MRRRVDLRALLVCRFQLLRFGAACAILVGLGGLHDGRLRLRGGLCLRLGAAFLFRWLRRRTRGKQADGERCGGDAGVAMHGVASEWFAAYPTPELTLRGHA